MTDTDLKIDNQNDNYDQTGCERCAKGIYFINLDYFSLLFITLSHNIDE